MTVDYKKLKNAIFEDNPIFFVTPNPIYAIGLEKIIKNYFIICSQKSDIVRYLKKEKIAVLCLNDNKIKNAGKILTNGKVVKYIKNKSKNKKANVITFKPSPIIQQICRKNNFKYLGNDWKLNRDLEDKIKFVEVMKKLKIPNADSKIIELNENECSLNFSKNSKFVIQFPRGFSGNSTFFIENQNDLNEILKKYKGRKVKLSKYFKGEAYTINACIVEDKTLIGKSMFQITGLFLYNKNTFGTCGNDYAYPKKLKKEQRKKIFNYTKKVGDYIKKLGYKGIFGLDFVVSDKKINLIEINPRIIGSMALFTKLQIQNKQLPFLLLHILELTPPSPPLSGGKKKDFLLSENINFKKWDKENDFNASQLILRNTKNRPIKIRKSLTSGIYEIEDNKLVLKKKTYSTDKNFKDNEFLVQCSAKGRMVSPDIEYANIQIGYGIMKNEKQFKDCFEKIVKLVMKNIKISEYQNERFLK